MISCAFCGRPNTDDSRFCIDCGKPVGPTAAAQVPPTTASAKPKSPSGKTKRRRSSPGSARSSGAEAAIAIVPPTRVNMSGATRTGTCGWCGNPVNPLLPYCAHCGRRSDSVLSAAKSCASCGAAVLEADTFCSACGTPLVAPPAGEEPESRTLLFSAKRREVAGPRLSVLDARGEVKQTVPITRTEVSVGRGSCDITFADDLFLSPLHAQFMVRDGALIVRDLGSTNRTWAFIETPCTLGEDETLLIGSQIFRVRRVGSPPAASSREPDGTCHMASLTPGPDVALVAQLRGDRSVRDIHYLAAGQKMVLGRDTGDWTFPYDQTMSGRHAELEDQDGALVIRDLGSRNGIAVAVRGERRLEPGQRLLVGDQVLRVESL